MLPARKCGASPRCRSERWIIWMDAWEEQLKLPNPMTASPSAMLSKLKTLPSFGSAAGWPGANAFPIVATNPLQFWVQFAEQWQKSWTEAMTFWTKAGKPH